MKPRSRRTPARSRTRPRSAPKARKVIRQQGVDRTLPKGQLAHIRWADVPLEPLNPLLDRQFVVGDQVMVARILLKKGAIVPEHRHINEQVTYVLEGALKFRIDGRDIVVHAGEVLTIPPDMPHAVEALTDAVDLDVFTPPRADWINKDDSYLRAGAAAGLQTTRR